jgi:hypothetical protein
MNPRELKMGIKEELEHKKHFPVKLREYYATEIAKDHLKEDSHYYSKLKKLR